MGKQQLLGSATIKIVKIRDPNNFKGFEWMYKILKLRERKKIDVACNYVYSLCSFVLTLYQQELALPRLWLSLSTKQLYGLGM